MSLDQAAEDSPPRASRAATDSPLSAAPNGWPFARIWAVCLVALVAATFRLWFPSGSYPIVPIFCCRWDGLSWMLWASSGLLVMAALLAASSRRWGRWGWTGVVAALLVGFVLDQHRLQPWAYQSLIYGLVFINMTASRARTWLMPLAASIYIYSAAGKLDFQFTHTVGQDFLNEVLAPLGGMPAAWTDEIRFRLALLFPVTELAIGIGLLLPGARRFAAFAAIGMHVCLVAILGPWGLAHSAGVLTWNLALVVQAWFLFLKPSPRRAEPQSSSSNHSAEFSWGGIIARAAVIAALLLPLAERAGYWDHWLSWALYSPHSSRAEIEIHESVISELPDSAEPYIRNDRDGDGWRSLALDRWSLEQLGVPVYPQARYQLAAAVALIRDTNIQRQIRAIVLGPADRWDGRRFEKRLIGRSELREHLNQFWLSGG